jgi:predicted TIM-barrel fold metal-dependent hydrolase
MITEGGAKARIPLTFWSLDICLHTTASRRIESQMLPTGPIDCDIHPAVPGLAALMPHLPEPWAEILTQRGMHELDSTAYPANAPITARPDWRSKESISGRVYQNSAEVKAGINLQELTTQALDPWQTSVAICNCLYGAYLVHSEDMAAAIAQAINGWLAREWLDREPRLRASIVLPLQSPELSVAEIERWAGDRRFVQVLLPVLTDEPLGRRRYWPIYEAAERHGLAVGIHAGSMYRHPPTVIGWPTYYTEDYVAQAQAFQGALASLICEGVFDRFPTLKVVLIESGFTWMPASIWRLNKYWQGLRWEVPWLKRRPSEVVEEHVRFTLQPVDGPPHPDQLGRFMDHMGSDRLLLFSTDYPHWQFDGTDAVPEGLSPDLVKKIGRDNPLETYKRLQEVSP